MAEGVVVEVVIEESEVEDLEASRAMRPMIFPESVRRWKPEEGERA